MKLLLLFLVIVFVFVKCDRPDYDLIHNQAKDKIASQIQIGLQFNLNDWLESDGYKLVLKSTTYQRTKYILYHTAGNWKITYQYYITINTPDKIITAIWIK